jgi:benzylsuccinate CoA-transferase BbsF subunit
MANQIFEGIKVAEFSWAGVGPLTSTYLAEHGATVVKIESHNRLDPLRGSSPFTTSIPDPDASMMYGRFNPNKRCVTIDLQHPNGRKLVWKLLLWADIITESFSPGTMAKWGIGYEDVKKAKPDIIYLSTSMQGSGGPHSSYSGFGMNAVNLSGFSEITGWPDKMPAAPQGAYTDFICPRFDILAIMAALIYRRHTGQGQWIEQSQFESSLHFLASPVMDYQINGNIMSRAGNRLPDAAPHGVFQCQGNDNWVAISALNDNQWKSLCQAIGNPDLSSQKEYATLSDRKKNEETLEKLVTSWTSGRTAEEAEITLQQHGVPAQKVYKSADVYLDPQLKSRTYFVPLQHPLMGEQKYEAHSCFILSKTPRQVTLPSPCLGEHNEYVFKELLKMSDEEIAEHLIDGSITTQLPVAFKASM